MNRNIVSPGDVANIRAGRVPVALRNDPSTWSEAVVSVEEAAGSGTSRRTTRIAGVADATGPGGVPVPTSDDYLTKLLKYVPAEVLGAYLLLAGTITSNVTGKRDLTLWLGYTLIGFAVVTVLYDWRVLNVVRPVQIAMSVVGLGVYVFSIGGWFATTSWYHSWYAAIALPIYGLAVAIIPVNPLPQ